MRKTNQFSREVGRRLRFRRMQMALRQGPAADAMGIAVSTLGRWERGLNSPTLDQLDAYASVVLEISVLDLLSLEIPADLQKGW